MTGRAALLLVAGLAPGVAAAGVTWFPGEDAFGTLLFEDQFPCGGDRDFNDVVIAYNYTKVDDGALDRRLTATLHVAASGASSCNGVALRLPIPAATVSGVEVRLGAPGSPDGVPWGPATPLVPEVVGGQPVLWLTDDLRGDWCDGATGFLNTDPDAPITTCRPVVVDVALTGTTVPASEPFDLFLTRCDDRTWQVHRPAYAGLPSGSGTFDASLLGQCHAAAGGPPTFVQGASGPVPGLPWAINVGEGIGGEDDPNHWWMQEKLPIDHGAPRIVPFAAGTAGYSDWYAVGTVGALHFTDGQGTPPSDPVSADPDALDYDADGWCPGYDADGPGGSGPTCFGAGLGPGDCDPVRAFVHPTAPDVADGFDDDCDGIGRDGVGHFLTSQSIAGGVREYTRFIVDGSATVTVTGTSPLDLYAWDHVEISGVLNLNGQPGLNSAGEVAAVRQGGVGGAGGFAGGNSACCGGATLSTPGSGPGGGGQGAVGPTGGGGAGGGHGTAGAAGTNGSCTPPRWTTNESTAGGAAGSAYNATPTLVGGSGGGGGGRGGADNDDGASGGGGGGAVRITSPLIDMHGTLIADGGAGGSLGSAGDGGAAGGGAGGLVWLVGDTVLVHGPVRARGGTGGTTSVGASNCVPGPGGIGGKGRIWIDAGALDTVGGSFDPAWAPVP